MGLLRVVEIDNEDQHGVVDYRNRCIDDHEMRLRHLEANNKEQAKLFVMSEKLENQIQALDDKTDVRFKNLEKWMDSQIAIIAVERATQKERVEEVKDTKKDLFGIIALVISCIVLILNILKG